MKDQFERLTGQSTTREEARNGLLHISSLSLTKLADGLIDPKLVLSWLLSGFGVPAYFISMLVPLREAGALLPQIFLSRVLSGMRQRRWMWVTGSAVQGVAVLAIAVSALTLRGAALGVAVCAALTVFALARAAASVSYKDILGKTVEQSKRGAVTGTAGSVSSALVFVFALLLISGVLKSQGAVIAAIAVAGGLWLIAATVFSRLSEDESETEGPRDVSDFWQILREDANLRRFIWVRGLLVSTALAPPFLVILGSENGSATGQLGALVLASSAAGFLSAYIWGRLADWSSRLMLTLTGFLGAAALVAAILLELADLTEPVWVMPAILFVLMVGYQGVRQARSTYLVDISPEDRRSANAALANTVIGVILLLAGLLGGLLSWIGPLGALAGYAVMSALGGLFALGLRDVGE